MSYEIFHTGKIRTGYMHDATRPWLVLEHYHSGYKGGMRTMVHGRYMTEGSAKQTVRRIGGTLKQPTSSAAR